MKPLSVYFIFLFLLNSTLCFAQENRWEADSILEVNIEKRRHEVKMGVIQFLVGARLDFEYERILNKYTSFGGNTMIGLGNDETDNQYTYNIAFTSFYRIYFTETKEYGTQGFFAQPFMGYYSGKEKVSEFSSYPNYQYRNYYKRFNTVALGFGLGKKWINKQGYVFQLILGGGRNFIRSNDAAPEGVFRGDLYIGYRF